MWVFGSCFAGTLPRTRAGYLFTKSSGFQGFPREVRGNLGDYGKTSYETLSKREAGCLARKP